MITNESYDRIIKTTYFFIGIKEEVNTVITQEGKLVPTNCQFFMEKNKILIGFDEKFIPKIYLTNGEEILDNKFNLSKSDQDFLVLDVSKKEQNVFIKNYNVPDEFFLKSVEFSGLFSTTTQKWLIKGDYDALYRLNSGLFIVNKNNLLGVVDTVGTLLSKIEADNIFTLGNFIVWAKDDFFGLYDQNFNEIVPPKQDNLALQPNNLIYYFNDGKVGIIDANGRLVSKAIYNNIVKQGKSYKAYTDDYLVLYDFSDRGVYQSEKKFSNVVIIKSRMEFSKLESINSNRFGAPPPQELGFGWYVDSIPYVKKDKPEDTLYTKKWGMKNNLDSITVKPIYFNPQIISSDFSLAYLKKPSVRLPKTLPTVNSLPYDKRFDIIDNVLQKKVNTSVFYHINFIDTNSTGFMSFFDKNGIGIMKKDFSVIRNDLTFIDKMKDDASRFCVQSSEIIYQEINSKGVSAIDYWQRSGSLLSDGVNNFAPSKPYAIFKDAKWGYLRNDGSELFPPQFKYVQNFNKGVAFVFDENWGAVNKDSIIIPLIYDEVSEFLMNEVDQIYQVKIVSKPTSLFYDTLAQLIELEYSVVQNLANGFLLVRSKEGFGIVNSEGEWSLKPSLKRKPDCKTGYCLVKESKYGVIDFEGNQLVECVYDDIINYLGDGLVVVKKSGKLGVGNDVGDWIVAPIATSIQYENGLLKVSNSNSVKLYTISGQLLSKKKWEYYDIDQANNKMMYVSKGKTVIVDLSTQKKLVVLDKVCLRFLKGLLIIKDPQNTSLIGAINEKGESVIPTHFSEISLIFDSIFLVKKEKELGLLSVQGKEIIPVEYKKITAVFQDYFAAIKQGKIDFYNHNGKIVYSMSGFDVAQCNDSLIMIKGTKKITYLNAHFENHFNDVYFDGYPFIGQYTSVLTKDGWVILGINGQVMCAGLINKLIPRGDNIFQCEEMVFLGLYDAKGKLILEPVYDKINYLGDGVIRCEKNGKIGYIDTKGNWIFSLHL